MKIIESKKSRYEIEEGSEPLSGGFGRVFKAIDLNNGNTVALKTLREEYIDNKGMVRRFVKEGEILYKLKHSNIIKIIDNFQYDEIPFIAMEWVDKSLKDILIENDGRIDPVSAAMGYITPVLEALVHAHSWKIYHQDIHPGNILLDNKGIVKLADFGLAQIYWESTEGQEILHQLNKQVQSRVSREHLLNSTMSVQSTANLSRERREIIRLGLQNLIDYAPPMAQEPGFIKSLSRDESLAVYVDIYSATMVLREMVTGEIDRAPIGTTDKKWSEIKLEGIINQGLHSRPEKCYKSSKELLKALDTWDRPSLAPGEKRIGRRIAIGTTVAAITFGIVALSTPHINRYLANRRNTTYVAQIERAMELRVDDIREAKKTINDILVKIDKDNGASEKVRQMASRGNELISPEYEAAIAGDIKVAQGVALGLYADMQSRLDTLLSENAFEAIEIELSRTKDFLSKQTVEAVKLKLVEVDVWEREKYLPAKILASIDDIKNTKDYRQAKTKIDELLKYCDSVEFKDKLTTTRQIQALHSQGISEEETILQSFFNEYAEVKRLTSTHQYKDAMQKARSLVDKINLYNPLYFNQIQSRHRGTNSELGKMLSSIRGNPISISSISSMVEQYINRDVKPNYDVIVRLEQKAKKLFRKYDSLLKGQYGFNETALREDIGFKLVEAHKEIQGVINNLSKEQFEGYKELQPKFDSYQTRIVAKIEQIAKEKMSYFQNQFEEKRLRSNKDNLSKPELEQLEKELLSLNSEIKMYKPILQYIK